MSPLNARNSKFSAAAGCLELYCKGCAVPGTDNHVQDFICALTQAPAARSSIVRSTKMHCISATAAKSMYATSSCAHTVKSQLVRNALKIVPVRVANKMNKMVLALPYITQDPAAICLYDQCMYKPWILVVKVCHKDRCRFTAACTSELHKWLMLSCKTACML